MSAKITTSANTTSYRAAPRKQRVRPRLSRPGDDDAQRPRHDDPPRPAGSQPSSADPSGDLQEGGPPAAPTKRYTVVIADDYEDIRLMVSAMLEASDRFAVVGEAANGRIAVDLASRYQPDLLVLDLAMPVMSGLEALPLIRATSPATRVVVFSGFAEAAMAGHTPADGYIEKGAPMVEVVERMLAIVEGAATD